MDCRELMIIKNEPCYELPLQVKLPESGLATIPRRRNRIHGKVVENPDWLPSGWITETKTRKSGSSAGHTDKYYFEPVNGIRFRSKIEVLRYLETGFKHRPKGLPNAQEQSDNPTSGCCKPVLYYRPVLCESPLYAEHPGLYPVIYFPTIGNNSEDQYKQPPLEFLQNLKDLKPIFAHPHNVPIPPCWQDNLFTEAFGPQNNAGYQASSWHTISENVQGGSVMKKKPRLDCGLAARNAGDFNPHENSYRVSNPISPNNSLAMSCNISSFTVATPAGFLSSQLPYSSFTSVLEQHYLSPFTIQHQNQPKANPNPVRPMRGQLSQSQLNAYKF